MADIKICEDLRKIDQRNLAERVHKRHYRIVIRLYIYLYIA